MTTVIFMFSMECMVSIRHARCGFFNRLRRNLSNPVPYYLPKSHYQKYILTYLYTLNIT